MPSSQGDEKNKQDGGETNDRSIKELVESRKTLSVKIRDCPMSVMMSIHQQQSGSREGKVVVEGVLSLVVWVILHNTWRRLLNSTMLIEKF